MAGLERLAIVLLLDGQFLQPGLLLLVQNDPPSKPRPRPDSPPKRAHQHRHTNRIGNRQRQHCSAVAQQGGDVEKGVDEDLEED
jgi:hypothetical protein